MNYSIVNFDLITERGKQLEPKFILNDDDKLYYKTLWNYFAKLKEKETNKGLYIAGQLGTGKTISLKIMQQIFGGFKMISSRHLMREFMQSKVNGMDILDIYGRNSFVLDSRGNRDIKRPIHLFIDDLGLDETESKMYGNQSNVLMEIILDRYDCWIDFGLRTLITTNASPEIIEKNYGKRVRERLREMCEYIVITGKSKRM